MGNCMEAYTLKEQGVVNEQEQENEKKPSHSPREDNHGKGGTRLKIVLRKEDLEWLMYQLNEKGGKSLEDLLREMEKGRGNVEEVKIWKPSLESIMESPEVHEMDKT
ncbi:hypothetical protein IFM89_032104 [Coptis chinensis]|uniref:Uncharacterized protein n=1 Tax=Coptis chinensis TaxID=261450 RepID=A0A835I2J2_9MAGN|nr:hypothetical protein IFM89_024415 [Coptis chinensis]KAF9611435.1 hypothetical protein IFM89_032104 [Coptis chinensis]